MQIIHAPTAGDARKAAHILPPQCAVAAPLSPSSEIRTKADRAPAKPGTTENPESGATSAPSSLPALKEVSETMLTTTIGGSGCRRGVPQADGDYQRQRDTDHPAATWCSDSGEFVQATGPPPATCTHDQTRRPGGSTGNHKRKARPP